MARAHPQTARTTVAITTRNTSTNSEGSSLPGSILMKKHHANCATSEKANMAPASLQRMGTGWVLAIGLEAALSTTPVRRPTGQPASNGAANASTA